MNGAVEHAVEFLRLQRAIAGDAQPRAMRAVDADVLGGLADGVHRRAGRGQRRAVDGRLDDDDPPSRVVGTRAAQQFRPGQRGRLAVGARTDDEFEAVECRGHGGGRGAGLVERRGGLGQQREHAAQTGVGGQASDEGLGLGQAVGEVLKHRHIQIEQPVAPEERVAGRIEDAPDEIGPRLELGDQLNRLGIGGIAVLGIDHQYQAVGKARKRGLVGGMGLAEGQLG